MKNGQEGKKGDCNFLEHKNSTSQYLILFLEVGYHDNGGAIQLPNHPPEVRES